MSQALGAQEMHGDLDVTRPTLDAKGRPRVHTMSDREIAEENLIILRATQDLVEQFFADFSSGKMGGAMGMLGKLMG